MHLGLNRTVRRFCSRFFVLTLFCFWKAPILEIHKRKDVCGIAYKVVNVCAEAGDASPSTPIGVNLPNLTWVRSKYGSKSVSLGNIETAYDCAQSPDSKAEFCFDEADVQLDDRYGSLSSKIHTALHEVLGHASGQLEDGVAQPHHSLGLHYSTLEEARFDI